MSSRATAQREWQLLSWWLAQYHPHARIFMNKRIGPSLQLGNVYPMDAATAQISRLRNRWVDTVYIENGQLYLVEAEMEPDPGAFSQLIHYARLLRMDPEWASYAGVPLNLQVVVARDDPSVAAEASMYQIKWIVYQPSFLASDHTMPTGEGVPVTPVPLPTDWPARISLLNLGKV